MIGIKNIFFLFSCLFIVLLKFLSSSFFFVLFQSDHMHVLCVYIKLYSIVKVFWWNQEVAELFLFCLFFAFAFPVWSYLNILLYMYVCTIYIQKIYMYMYVYGFALITFALCLYLCHSLVNFLDLSVPILKMDMFTVKWFILEWIS